MEKLVEIVSGFLERIPIVNLTKKGFLLLDYQK